MKTQNLKFGEAVKTLANLAGIRPYTFSKQDEERENNWQKYTLIYSTYINYYHEELLKNSDKQGQIMRLGGLVSVDSFQNETDSIFYFSITDGENEIDVKYEGILPNLFAEGKGVIAEGKLKDKKYIIADKILAKHDENNMPPEVKEALEKSQN